MKHILPFLCVTLCIKTWITTEYIGYNKSDRDISSVAFVLETQWTNLSFSDTQKEKETKPFPKLVMFIIGSLVFIVLN